MPSDWLGSKGGNANGPAVEGKESHCHRSPGMGLAIAQFLAGEGVEVTIPGRSNKKVQEAIASLGANERGVESDLGTLEGARKLIEQVPETDILVNNLGIYESKTFVDITDEDWLHYFEVNLLSGIRLSRHYFPLMIEKNRGRVIFVSCEAGAETHPDIYDSLRRQ
jgi:NAD(P)-dependent dehydrogenase (short-subunit alcohol dehydrogenase family)